MSSFDHLWVLYYLHINSISIKLLSLCTVVCQTLRNGGLCLCQLRAPSHSNCIRLFPRAMSENKGGRKEGRKEGRLSIYNT